MPDFFFVLLHAPELSESCPSHNGPVMPLGLLPDLPTLWAPLDMTGHTARDNWLVNATWTVSCL